MLAPTQEALTVQQLLERYQLGSSGMYNRFKALGMIPEHQGKRLVYPPRQVAVLDALHRHVQARGSLATFVQRFEAGEDVTALAAPDTTAPQSESAGATARTAADSPESQAARERTPTPHAGGTEEDVTGSPASAPPAEHRTPSTATARADSDLLWPQRTIAEAHDRGWHLSAAQLGRLLEQPAEDLAGHRRLVGYGFIFIRSEGEWRITTAPVTHAATAATETRPGSTAKTEGRRRKKRDSGADPLAPAAPTEETAHATPDTH